MYHKKLILTALLAMYTASAWAQVPLPHTMNAQAPKGTSTETSSTTSLPYSSQASFNMMEDASVPQSTVKTTSPSYIGVLGEKWETDKRGRRNTFLHNGQEMSVGYELPKNEPEHTIQIARPDLPSSLSDSLAGKLTDRPPATRVAL